MSFTSKKHKLEGASGEEEGGLIIQKKSRPDKDEGVFKKPGVSLLGLDALARAKRKEQADEKRARGSTRDHESSSKKPRTQDEEEGGGYSGRGNMRVSFGTSGGHSRDRQYRWVWLINGILKFKYYK